MIRQSLKSSLGREVSWSALTLSWSQGLALKGLTLGPAPPPLLKARVAEALVIPKVSYRNGRARVDLVLRVTGVAAELAPGPPKPPAPYQEPLTAFAEALQKFQALDWPLPLDLALQVAIDPVQASYRDPQSRRQLELQHAALFVEVPSLADRPITAKLRGDLVVDGHRIEALSASVELKNLVS